MEKQPVMNDVADQLEQLVMEIILSVLLRLKNELASKNNNIEMKFWASGETESGNAGEQPDKG